MSSIFCLDHSVLAHSLHTHYIKFIQWLKEKISAKHDIGDKLGNRKGIWETPETVLLLYRVVRFYLKLFYLNDTIKNKKKSL